MWELPNEGEVRAKPKIFCWSFLALAHKLLSGLEGLFQLADTRKEGGIKNKVPLHKVLIQWWCQEDTSIWSPLWYGVFRVLRLPQKELAHIVTFNHRNYGGCLLLRHLLSYSFSGYFAEYQSGISSVLPPCRTGVRPIKHFRLRGGFWYSLWWGWVSL